VFNVVHGKGRVVGDDLVLDTVSPMRAVVNT
jgi:hypothetical protein